MSVKSPVEIEAGGERRKITPSAATLGSALWQLVVSKTEIPNYAEWHARMRPIQTVGELKQKLIAARRRAKILSHKYQIAKEKLCR